MLADLGCPGSSAVKCFFLLFGMVFQVISVMLNEKSAFFYFCLFSVVLFSDVISDDHIGATFAETNSLPVIKRAYSLKAAKEPKDTSKVTSCVLYLSSLTAIFLGGPGLASTRMSPLTGLYWSYRCRRCGDNWSYKTCKLQSNTNKPTPNF